MSHHTRTVFARNGIDGALHRFRHSYCTNLLRSGSSIRVVQELARHSSLKTTAGYTAVDETERIEAIGRLAS